MEKINSDSHGERVLQKILSLGEHELIHGMIQNFYENNIWAPLLAHRILTKKYRKNPCSAYLLKFASFVLSAPEEYSTAELRYFNTLTSIPLPNNYRIML